MENVSIADARQNLPALVHQVERSGPLQLTRRGKPVAVLLSQSEYARLGGEKKLDLWESILLFRENNNLSGVQFTEDDFEGLRDPGPPREFSWPE